MGIPTAPNPDFLKMIQEIQEMWELARSKQVVQFGVDQLRVALAEGGELAARLEGGGPVARLMGGGPVARLVEEGLAARLVEEGPAARLVGGRQAVHLVGEGPVEEGAIAI